MNLFHSPGPCIGIMLGCLLVSIVRAGSPGEIYDNWRIAEIYGESTVVNLESNLVFVEDGSLAANAGCNQIRAGFDVSENSIQFTLGMLTRMACPEPNMVQENQFLRALESTTHYVIESADSIVSLSLMDDSGKVLIYATKTEPQ